jgi:spore germination cell wall hydrolase CwlJ-like protein
MLLSSDAPLAPDNAPKVELGVSAKQYKCLLYNTLFESGDQPLQGMIGVVYVVLNRTTDKNFCQTIFAKNQFSWTNNEKLVFDYIHNRLPHLAMDQYLRSIYAINAVLTGSVSDPTDGAQFYHTLYVNPSWDDQMQKTAVIGEHVFFRGKDNRS